MEFEETEAYTPRGSKKSGVSKAASSVKKLLTRRMAKAVSSERALGSSGSLDVDAPSSKRFGLRHRRSKTREKVQVERGAVTDRERRSFSFDDMSKLGKEETAETLKPLEADVKVPARKDTKDATHFKSITDNLQGYTPPETPVPEKGQDILTSSSANNAEEGTKQEDVTPAVTGEKAEVKKQVKEIEAVETTSHSFDVALDAAAQIDAGIEEAVMKSLKGKADKEGPAAITQTKQAVEKVVQAEGSGAKIKTRDMNVGDLIPQKREASGKEAATEEKQVSKPKRRRLKLLKNASFSLATIAVGLLIIILKNKN